MKFPFRSLILTACAGIVCAACQQHQSAPRQASPLAATVPAELPPNVRYAMADCHLHLVDFLQHTDGISAALAAMAKCGVEDAVVSGMPVVKEWAEGEHRQPEYYLADDSRVYWYSATDVLVARQVQSLPREQQLRVHPVICGFNGADRNAIDHVKRMVDWYPGLWQGIGEVMTRHDDLTALTYGQPARADNLALAPIYDFAGKHDMPVFIHSDIGSVWEHEPIYESEIENAVKAHPNTRFVWCHAGISRRIVIPTLTTDLETLLKKYPNLWIDVSWVVYDQDLLTPDGKPDPKWIALIEEFPTRFMIGTDKVGHFSDYPQEIFKYYKFLDALDKDTAKRLARENLLSVLPASAARLSEEESNLFNGNVPPGTELMKDVPTTQP